MDLFPILSVKYRDCDAEGIRRIVEECGGVCEKVTVVIHLARVTASQGEDIEVVRQRLLTRPEVVTADYAVKVKTRVAYHAATDDTHLDRQHHLKRTNVFNAWKHTKGSPSVKVAVVDTGLVASACLSPTGVGDIPVPDFGFRGEDDANVPWDYATEEMEGEYTDYSHGTTCYAIIKATANNSAGVAGIAPDCYGIMVACSASTWPDIISIYAAEGIIEATDAGARIISTSWGFSVPVDANEDPTSQWGWDMFAAVEYALAADVIFINAAGNFNEYYPSANTYGSATSFMYPAEVDGVILVSSAGGPSPHTEDCPWNENVSHTPPTTNSGPAYGAGIDFVVPAGDVFTILGPGYGAPAYANVGPNYGYGAWWDGLIIADGVSYGGGASLDHHHSTSFAAPQIAGIAALVLSINPALTSAEVISILRTTGTDGQHADFATRYPNAVVPDAGAAVRKALATLPANSGVVYPYLRFWGTGVETTVTGGDATTTLDGDVTFEVTGYSSNPVTSVELWIGGKLNYSGTPTTISFTANGTGTPAEVKVVARTSSGTTTETYSDIILASSDLPIYVDGLSRTIGTGRIQTSGLQEKQVAVADALAAADSLSPQMGTVLLSLADAIAASDTLTPRLGNVLIALADALAASESATGVHGQVKVSLATAVSLADSVNAILSGVKFSEADALALTEAMGPQVGDVKALLADALALADSLTGPKVGTVLLALADAISATEGLTPKIGSVQLSALESLGATDALTAPLIGGLQINFATGLSLADALQTLHGGVKASVATQLALAESLTADTLTPWQWSSSLALTKGAISSGILANTASDDGTELVLTEVTGVYVNETTGGGFTYDFTFGEDEAVPTTALHLHMMGWYKGNAAHIVKLQQWNYSTTAWVDVTANADDFPSSASEQTYQFHLIDAANYLSGGKIKLRMIHPSNGVATHYLHIDQMYLMRAIGVHDVEDALALTEFLTLKPGTVLVSETDTASLSDSLLARFGDVQIVTTTALSLAEILTAKVGSVIITADESLDAFEVITVLASGDLQININISDNLSLSEVLATLPSGLKMSVLESLLLEEVFSTGGNLSLSVADALALVDSLTTPQVGQMLLSLSDAIDLSDALAATIGDLKVSVAEGATLAEALEPVLSGVAFSVYDDASIADDLAIRIGMLNLVVSDAIDLLDAINAVLGDPAAVALTLTDTVALAESLTPLLGDLTVLLADVLDLAEAATVRKVDTEITESDALLLEESVALLLSALQARMTETLSIVDSTTVLNYRQIASESFKATGRHRHYDSHERIRRYKASARDRHFKAKGN